MSEYQEIYSISEVCKLFKLTRQTMYKLEKQGILVPIRIGKIRRYRKEDIDKIINQNKENINVAS